MTEPTEEPMENQSKIDPSRKTIGAIYRDAQLYGDRENIEVGNMVEEMMKGYLEDLNEAILSKPFGEETPYYIQIAEKKDLQMKSALRRIVRKYRFRPWPEADTDVYYHNPVDFQTFFCWSIPHHTEMHNILANQNLFDADMVSEIKAWRAYDLQPFGFIKDQMGNWVANPQWKDRSIEEYSKRKKMRKIIGIYD